MENTNLSLEGARGHWMKLAEDELSWARFCEENSLYGDTTVYYNRANTYQRTAQAIQMQIDTGVPVCACCFKPFGEGTIDRI